MFRLTSCFASLSFFLFCCTQDPGHPPIGAEEDWPVSLGDKFSSQYSQLGHIHTGNVNSLELAWTYRSGDLTEKNNTQIQCNPLIIDGVLYGSSPTMKAFALDAATGVLKWEFDPKVDYAVPITVNRGLTYFQHNESARLFFSAGSFLFAIDAATGRLVKDFGDAGKVSLKEGLGEWAQDLYVISTSPGVIYEDKIIIGTRVSENSDAAPGYIRAFNAVSGQVEWIFHTIPRPGEFGYETWPEDAYKHSGGANSWAGMSVDEARGLVFVPTGSASFDFWGGNRLGDNLFANSLLALDANTGKRVWHYQTIRHDIWDRDLPAPPNLVRITHKGKLIDAVAQITKTGRVFVFDRETGEPIFPIEEIDVPRSDLFGEVPALSQPLPSLPRPFSRQVFTDEEITNISAEAREYVRNELRGKRYGHMFRPPSTQGTVIFPGFDGGGEWGGAAFDPESGWLYVNANEMPWILTMVSTQLDKDASLGSNVYMLNCSMCHGPNRQGDPTGDYPSLLGLAEKYPATHVAEMIANGKGRMPGFQHLGDVEREAVLSFVMGAEEASDDAHTQGIESNRRAVPYTHTGYNRFFDHEGYPAVKPPWGTLNAIDLNTGEIAWQVPLGEFAELTERGIPKTGTENYGGPVVTAGGLVFIGASKDEYFRAFDKKTGEELWKYKLPAAGYATPSVYAVNGKQYVVIAAGGGKIGTPSGDYYMAFSINE